MSCNHSNTFNNVSNIGENQLINQLETNLKHFLDWGFLNIGGFININIPTSGLYGGSFSSLKSVSQPGYRMGQVWQTFKKDWVWESGITYNNYQPILFSGLYINNTFYPGPTGNNIISYTINYPMGQIIFNSPLSATSNIQANYAYRWCQVYKNSSDSQWKELQELTYKPVPQINQANSGEYAIGASHRVQMPAIVIEPISRSYSQPWQLGSYDFAVDQDILLHVFTENAIDNNKIIDIIRLQKNKTIILYDINKVVNSGTYPLTYNGSLNPNGLCYTDLLENYRWNLCYFKEISVLNMESANKNLYWCTLRLTTQVII
jgi:hypothetical protein